MRILYLSPHQDDEVLTFGASIMADIAAGHEVWVYLVCRGDKSVARTSPTLINRLGYTPTVEAFCEARDREFAASVPNLGADMMLLPQLDREPEQETIPVRIAASVQAAFGQGFDMVCAHALSDPHIDHANTGRAAQLLADSGWAGRVRFHVAFYNRQYHQPPPPLSTRGAGFPVTLAEQEPYRRVDVPNGFWGVGYISVSSYFNNQLTDPLSDYFEPPGQPALPAGGVLRSASGLVARSASGAPIRFYRAFELPPGAYSTTDHGNGTMTLVGGALYNHANGTTRLFGLGGVDNNNGTTTLTTPSLEG